jgi:hypothetical protein
VLKKYKQPFGLMASLRESVDARLKRKELSAASRVTRHG